MRRSRSLATWESAGPYVVYVFDEMTGLPTAFGPYRDGWAALEASEVLRREIEGPSGGGCPPLTVQLVRMERVEPHVWRPRDAVARLRRSQWFRPRDDLLSRHHD